MVTPGAQDAKCLKQAVMVTVYNRGSLYGNLYGTVAVWLRFHPVVGADKLC